MLMAPLVLRSDAEFGLLALLMLFAVVWATDVLGYFVGRAFGGPKLAPRMSPKKTWSGALGGTIAAIIVALVVARIANLPDWPLIAGIALLLSAASQAGDIFESALKRRFGAKDSSHLIPGHGGVMDRLDGFWAASLIAVIIGLTRGGFDAPARALLVW
jgi:phosphatidate cytidylyltransferase